MFELLSDVDAAAYKTHMKRNADYKTNKRGGKRARTSSTNLDVLVAKKVKRALAQKTDYRVTDHVVIQQALAITGNIQSLTQNLARGDLDFNNYEGNTIYPKYLRCNYEILSTVGSISTTVRVIIGQQLKGSAIPTAANLMQIQTNGAAAISMPNNDFSNVFKILHDKVHALGGYGTTHEGVSSVAEQIYIDGFRLKPIEFTAAGNVVVGDLFVFICNNTTSATPHTVSYTSRIKFST